MNITFKGNTYTVSPQYIDSVFDYWGVFGGFLSLKC